MASEGCAAVVWAAASTAVALEGCTGWLWATARRIWARLRRVPRVRPGFAPRPFAFNHGFSPGFRSPFFRDGRFFRGGNTFAFGLGFGFPFGGGFWGSPGGFWGGYPYPAYGGFYPNDYSGAYAPSPNVTVIYPPSTGSDYYGAGEPSSAQPAEPAPSAVINEYHWGSSANEGVPQKTVSFSIAMRDSSVIDASAYWVDGDTLHYIDRQGKEKQVPVSQVDEARSQQLNRERGIEFGLPKSG